jgi:hypothetical protein
VRPVVFVGEEVLQGSEQKRAEPSLAAVGAAERVVFQQVNEERLRQILRVIRRMPAMPQKRVERRPVSLSEIREGLLGGLLRFRVRGELNDAPMRRSKRSPSLL